MKKEAIDRIAASNDIVAKNIREAYDFDLTALKDITPGECFKQYLEWEAIIGFDDWIKRAIKLIYGVELE